MAYLSFSGIGITAMAGAVPKRVVNGFEYSDFFPKEQVRQVVEKIGIYERRFADEETCASDLCYAAAEKLLTENAIDRSEIDLLIFVTQTPDYRMPSTAFLLQNRLGLSHSTIAFDINIGCSGFMYGLSVAYSMMQNGNLHKALVLDGDTCSRVYSPKDRRTAFIFGDAGIAALVERDSKFGNSYFSINSDGSRFDLIWAKAGGYRHMSSVETLEEHVVDEYGNIRREEDGVMKGEDVFNFVLVEVPRDIKNTLQFAGVSKEELDYYIFHQSNNFMNSYIAKKLKLDKDKVPHNIEKYGNTSSVSVPLTIVSELKDKLVGNNQLLLSAFGVGMSWVTGILPFVDTKICDMVEVEHGKIVVE